MKVTNLLGIMKETLYYIILYIKNEFIYTHKNTVFLLHLVLFYSCKCNRGQQAFSMNDSSTPFNIS